MARVYSVLLSRSWETASVFGIGECPETGAILGFGRNHGHEGVTIPSAER